MNSRLCATLARSFVTVSVIFGLGGCQGNAPPSPSANATPQPEMEHTAVDETEVEKAIGGLAESDQVSARAQKFCAVNKNERLGSMGVPVKIDVQGTPAFLCCAGCKRYATLHPDKVLTNLQELASANTPAATTP